MLLSDSLSAMLSLNFKGWLPKEGWFIQNIRRLVEERNRTGESIEFQWVPSHTGIHGNEVADTTAKAATLSGERRYILAVPWQDLYTSMKTEHVKNWYISDNTVEVTSKYYQIQTGLQNQTWFLKYKYSRA